MTDRNLTHKLDVYLLKNSQIICQFNDQHTDDVDTRDYQTSFRATPTKTSAST